MAELILITNETLIKTEPALLSLASGSDNSTRTGLLTSAEPTSQTFSGNGESQFGED